MAEPVYVETWEVVGNMGNVLDIAYTKSMCPTADVLDMFRRTMADEHNCTLKRLLKTKKIEFKVLKHK